MATTGGSVALAVLGCVLERGALASLFYVVAYFMGAEGVALRAGALVSRP